MAGHLLTFNALALRLLRLPRMQSTLMIAIDGGGGAGKSTFAESLSAEFGTAGAPAAVVRMDDFFQPDDAAQQPAPDGFVDGEMDWRRLRDQVIGPLRSGGVARYPRFDWPTRTLQEWHVILAGGVVIIEGIGVLRQELVGGYDFRIWVCCPPGLRLERGVLRDGQRARRRWEHQWLPADARFVELHDPEQAADLVVDGSGNSTAAGGAYFLCVRGW